MHLKCILVSGAKEQSAKFCHCCKINSKGMHCGVWHPPNVPWLPSNKLQRLHMAPLPTFPLKPSCKVGQVISQTCLPWRQKASLGGKSTFWIIAPMLLIGKFSCKKPYPQFVGKSVSPSVFKCFQITPKQRPLSDQNKKPISALGIPCLESHFVPLESRPVDRCAWWLEST